MPEKPKRPRGRPASNVRDGEYEARRREQIREIQAQHRVNIKRVEFELSKEDYERLEKAAVEAGRNKKTWVTDLVLARLDALYPQKARNG